MKARPDDNVQVAVPAYADANSGGFFLIERSQEFVLGALAAGAGARGNWSPARSAGRACLVDRHQARDDDEDLAFVGALLAPNTLDVASLDQNGVGLLDRRDEVLVRPMSSILGLFLRNAPPARFIRHHWAEMVLQRLAVLRS